MSARLPDTNEFHPSMSFSGRSCIKEKRQSNQSSVPLKGIIYKINETNKQKQVAVLAQKLDYFMLELAVIQRKDI